MSFTLSITRNIGWSLALLTGILLSACADTKDGKPGEQAEPNKDTGTISRADLGEYWPLTVDFGVLACRVIEIKGYTGPRLTAVTFTSGGLTYAVNGTARSHRLGPEIDAIWAPGEPIWIDDPETKKKVNLGPPKKDIGPLIDAGLKLRDS